MLGILFALEFMTFDVWVSDFIYTPTLNAFSTIMEGLNFKKNRLSLSYELKVQKGKKSALGDHEKCQLMYKCQFMMYYLFIFNNHNLIYCQCIW